VDVSDRRAIAAVSSDAIGHAIPTVESEKLRPGRLLGGGGAAPPLKKNASAFGIRLTLENGPARILPGIVLA
jgi:hypothetical protein